MAEDLVAQSDVEAALLRPLADTETPYIATLIKQVSSRLRGRIKNLDARIATYEADPDASGGIDPARVASVLADVLKRYMVNPEGAASRSETTGPESASVSFASYGKAIGGTGRLTISQQDVDEILARPRRTRPGSIKLRAALALGHCRDYRDYPGYQDRQ